LQFWFDEKLTPERGRKGSELGHYAAFNGQLEVLTWLIEGPFRAPVEPALFLHAVYNGKIEVIEYLLAKGCPVDDLVKEVATITLNGSQCDEALALYSHLKSLGRELMLGGSDDEKRASESIGSMMRPLMNFAVTAEGVIARTRYSALTFGLLQLIVFLLSSLPCVVHNTCSYFVL